MKRIVWCTACVLAFLGASVAGGWWLGELLSPFSFDMPYWLDVTIRAGMHLVGVPDPLDPDDIETIGLFLLFLTYCIVVAVVLSSALFMLKRHLKKHRTG
ncbi:hypothetical protein [Burkholderia sp. Ax-1724]|uniref:hypothetical protein n=1 Tax=Burkholderia sp. Ax-1724 TaxID=2608336 RepID=UPI00141E8932|nr:hypothetical protein [Burkholderia sp. Ax-1724]NIF53008.1 hypothetical protein [Burkholderia sp. Ax-1724]